MELKKMADEMKAKLKDEKELQKVMEFAKTLCPDSELDLDDLDSVSGGRIGYYEDGEICDFDKVLLTILLGGYVLQHDDGNLTPESAKEGFIQYIGGKEAGVTSKVEELVEEHLREYFAKKGKI